MSAKTAPAIRHGVLLNTTDATETVASEFQTVTDRAYHVRASIVATETADHDEIAVYELLGAFKNDGGVLTQVGSTTAVAALESTAGWAVAFAVSGTLVQVKVTGAAATLATWRVDMNILEV